MNEIIKDLLNNLKQITLIHPKDVFLIEYKLRLHFFQHFFYMTVLEIMLAATALILNAASLFLFGTLLFTMYAGVLGYRILRCLFGKVYAIDGICHEISKKHSYIIIQINNEHYIKAFINPYNLRFHPKKGNLIRLYGEQKKLKKITSDLYELSPCYFAYIKQTYSETKKNNVK